MDLGVLVAVTTTSSRLVLDESFSLLSKGGSGHQQKQCLKENPHAIGIRCEIDSLGPENYHEIVR